MTFRIEAQTPDEREALTKSLSSFHADWGYVKSYSLNDLLGSWESTVSDVENGYRLSLPDYEISLSLRDEIETIRRALPSRLASEIELAVKPVDARFFAATRQNSAPVLSSVGGEELAAWWYRLPTGVVPTDGDDSWLPFIRQGRVEQLPSF